MSAHTTYNQWPRWMQLQTAAAYCDMSENYFKELVKDGVLPEEAFRQRRTARWDRAQIDEKLDAMLQASASSGRFAQRI